MTEVSSSVEVAVDPATAFSVFTDEMDLWQVRSPITFYDSARAVEQRCEPGVGGRVVEVYEDGELELARITVWEPGKRLSWKSSRDDVEVDIWFEEIGSGTNVRVDARVPDGGKDRGATSIVRVGPEWFGRWIARRLAGARHEIVEMPRLNLEVRYEKPVTAARWLADAFGFFDLSATFPADESQGSPSWIEGRIGDAALMLFQLEGSRGTSIVPWVYVDDLDAHFERSTTAGATVVEAIHQHGYRRYVCDDLEGNRWVFAQARPTMR